MWHTYGTWLPGDPRGFRNRHHRIHSSGDYKHPPPEGEHEGLHRYAKRVSKDEAVLATPELRKEVCDALLETIRSFEWRAMALTVCRVHVHLVIELPTDEEAFDKAMTDLKTRSSARVRNKPAQRLWARKWKPVLIEDEQHREDEIVYVRDKQGRFNCAWTHRDGFVRCN
jgi:REP element-mobilizing transposase RayT